MQPGVCLALWFPHSSSCLYNRVSSLQGWVCSHSQAGPRQTCFPCSFSGSVFPTRWEAPGAGDRAAADGQGPAHLATGRNLCEQSSPVIHLFGPPCPHLKPFFLHVTSWYIKDLLVRIWNGMPHPPTPNTQAEYFGIHVYVLGAGRG